MPLRRRLTAARATFAALLLLSALLATIPRASAAAAEDDPVTTGFDRVWSRTDTPQARGDRTFMWGPQPLVRLVIMEPMAGLGLQNDMRPVFYWDKARMEVNNPSGDPADPYYVTNGLLVSEMVTGRQQIGVNPVQYADRAPAEVPFGDLDDPTGPTFRSFQSHLQDAPLTEGQPVAQQIDRAGSVSQADAGDVTCQVVIVETKHCIASPFWTFLNQQGTIFDYDTETLTSGALFDPLFYATGLPIAEPYWITVRAGGKLTRVLIQLFERRTLTYNPANAAASRVEMGNVGLQYYNWRYTAILPGDPQTGLDPAMRAALGAIWDTGPKFQYLPQAVAGRYQLFFQPTLQDDRNGFASRTYHLIAVDTSYSTYPRGAGIILAHEMQHARDFNVLGGARNAAECYAAEARGFLTEAYLWMTWFGPDGKSPVSESIDGEENSIVRQIRTNPTAFANQLIKAYTDNKQCPAYPKNGTPDRLLTLDGLPEGIATALPVDQVFAALQSALANQQDLASLNVGDAGFTITPR
jgi:hypothetical protein